jgi:hypothetical protein
MHHGELVVVAEAPPVPGLIVIRPNCPGAMHRCGHVWGDARCSGLGRGRRHRGAGRPSARRNRYEPQKFAGGQRFFKHRHHPQAGGAAFDFGVVGACDQ